MSKLQRRFLDSHNIKVDDAQLESISIVEVETKESREDSPITETKIVGYSAVFNVKATIRSWFGDFQEMIAEGAFKRAISERHNVKALRNHEPDKLLGSLRSSTLFLREDSKGLWMEVTVPDTALGKETVELIKRGDMDGQSFAFVVTGEKWVAGENEELDLRIITDVELWDVGPVTYPAYDETTVGLRANSEARLDGLRALRKKEPAVARDARGELMHPSSVEARSMASVAQTEEEKVRAIVKQELAQAAPVETKSEETPDPSIADVIVEELKTQGLGELISDDQEIKKEQIQETQDSERSSSDSLDFLLTGLEVEEELMRTKNLIDNLL